MRYPLQVAAAACGFTHYPMVPCSRITSLFDETKASGVILASREEEAVAIGCGLSLTRQQPLVMMQSSGAANTLNTVGSLALAYRIPLVGFITLRGGPTDLNLTQRPVGAALPAILRELGADVIDCRAIDDIPDALKHAQTLSVSISGPAFVLLQEDQRAA